MWPSARHFQVAAGPPSHSILPGVLWGSDIVLSSVCFSLFQVREGACADGLSMDFFHELSEHRVFPDISRSFPLRHCGCGPAL